MGGFVGSYIGSMIRQAARNAEHAKAQKAGNQLLANRMQITAPWQPAMAAHPTFVCAHCGFPHVLQQTLFGCNACAAPYFPSEVSRGNKNGRLACVACSADQSVDAMPFCCINCRCIQGTPTNLDWRKTYPRLPAWRIFIVPLIAAIFGIGMLLFCLIGSQGDPNISAKERLDLTLYLGLLPLGLGGWGIISLLIRKKTPPEMMLSCGGFGYRTPEGEERWYSWRDVSGLEATQQATNPDTGSAHPDSTATWWTVRTAQEPLFFDNRLKQAREFARQIRMRAPAALPADLAPMQRSSPRVTIAVLVILAVAIGLLALFARP